MESYQAQKVEPVLRVTSLINTAYYSFPENFSFAGETHNFWELSYIDRGKIVIQHEQNKYLLKAGEMVFCKPNVFHKSWVWQGENASVITIAFEAEGIAMESFEKSIVVLNAEERQCISAIIREAALTYRHFYAPPTTVSMEKVKKLPYGSEQIICNRLEELIIYACRSERNILIDNRIIAADSQQHGADLVFRIKNYLEEHLEEKITLEELAEKNFISVSTLKRIFRLKTESSVMAYLTDLRIEKAKQLISEQKHTFSAIAEKTGFGSVHYFSTVFKKHTGITPNEYREKIS